MQRYEFTVIVNDEVIAYGEGPTAAAAVQEAEHYAMMQDANLDDEVSIEYRRTENLTQTQMYMLIREEADK